jgi:dTDP-glucose 4,6-dehydratase
MVADRPGHDRRYSISSDKLRGLGWKPQHSFESGLAETVEWYRTHREWWEAIKEKQDYREYYERQYAARLR